MQKINYGIDAPGLVRFFLVAGIVMIVTYLLSSLMLIQNAWWVMSIKILLVAAAIYFCGMGCLMIYWSKVVKIHDREIVLDEIKWRGDEQVLDVGCGRGLMAIGAAKRLKTGRVIGIDIWQAKDQSANTPAGALENARIEGVLDRMEIKTADMRALPFADNSFDVIVSHWVVHNLESKSDRELSLSEMARVLKPKGQLILCDIENRDAYVTYLRSQGMVDCRMKFSTFQDSILGAVSFGSFRPTSIFAKKY